MERAARGLRIAVTGASGLIGTAVAELLAQEGHRVDRLVRREPREPGEIFWNAADAIDARALEGIDAAIHLAGESVAGRWTPEKKDRIRRSRVESTALLARTLAALDPRPRALLCASAVGYYGDRGDEILTEESAPGEGFLAEVCQAWEAAADPARAAGIRVAHLRIGIVLSGRGGALPRLLPAFRMGMGGPIGSGRQWMSWISRVDVARLFLHALAREELSGAVNAVAPEPVRNAEFAQVLGRVLHRPAILPVPAAAIRLLFGEMGEATILASQRVVPRRAVETGFVYRQPDLEGALRAALAE